MVAQPELIPMTEADVVALLQQLADEQLAEDQAASDLEAARGAWKTAKSVREKRQRQIVDAFRQVRDTTTRKQAAFNEHLAAELHDLLQQPEPEPPAADADESEA